MMKKILIISIIGVSSMLTAQSHVVRQVVHEWPAGYDTTGIHWYVYQPENPWVKILDQDAVGSFTNFNGGAQMARWNADVGNFPTSPPWSVGDTIIAFGAWDSAYATDPAGYQTNPNHTGYFWLCSDTLTVTQPQTWQPDDTLRIMPKPIAYLQSPSNGIDTIVVKIPNPAQTQINISTYDIVGYELFVAEMSGTPSGFYPVAYVPCTGVYGDTTVFKELESNYPTGSTLYYSYKIVLRTNASDQLGGEL